MKPSGVGVPSASSDDDVGPIRVLHVDDDPEFAEMAARFLEREGEALSVTVVAGFEEALSRIDDDVDCIVSDYEMPVGTGLDLLERVRDEYTDVPFILFTGEGSEEIAVEAITAGVTDYIQKATNTDQFAVLANRIRNAVEGARAERALREQVAWFEALIEHSADAVVVVDEEGVLRYVTPSIRRISGYDPNELTGERFTEFVHPEDVDRVADHFISFRAEGEPISGVETRIAHAGGSWTWIEVDADDPVDSPIDGYVFTVRDVTARKERERELRRYRTMVETIGDGVYVLDEDYEFAIVNEALTGLTGYPREELLGSHLSLLLDDADLETAREGREELLAAESDVQTIEVDLQTAAGETIPAEIRYRLLPFEDGFRGTAGVIRDVTERRERERELERRNERLDRFASVVSHDLRNPLNVAQGFCEIAREQDDLARVDRIEDSLDRMERLIEDLLALARSGDAIGERERVGLDIIFADAWRSIDAGDVDLHIEPSLGSVAGDPTRLRQLAGNLLGNAIEHGGGSIRVGSCSGGFFVSDDGPGVPARERQQVFEAGYTTAEEGTGLGLAIVSDIVEAHGWELDVAESEAGGARFEVTAIDSFADCDEAS